jgi:threonine aldolase
MGQSAGVAAQFMRAFTDDFALDLARQTNSRASELAHKVTEATPFAIAKPVQSNLVLVSVPESILPEINEKYPEIMVWKDVDPERAGHAVLRFITNYSTTSECIDETVRFLKELGGQCYQ